MIARRHNQLFRDGCLALGLLPRVGECLRHVQRQTRALERDIGKIQLHIGRRQLLGFVQIFAKRTEKSRFARRDPSAAMRRSRKKAHWSEHRIAIPTQFLYGVVKQG